MIWTILFAIIALVSLWWALYTRQIFRREMAYLIKRNTNPPPVEPISPLFRYLSEALDVGVVLIDGLRNIQYCNTTAVTMFGVPSERVLNRGIITLIRDYQADTLIEQSLKQRVTHHATLRPVLSQRTIRLSCEPLAHGGALIITHDLTQLSLLERSRRDLVANVSHELRTPLASIKLLTETLATQPPPDIANRMFGQIDSELDAVMHLVDELHELAQIESGRTALQLQSTNVHDIVERAAARIQPQTTRKGITLHSDITPDLPNVYVDRERIGQVLLNLLHNAVKWTDQGGTITIQATIKPRQLIEPQLARISEPSEQWVILAIQDTGAGIPADALPRIFERFYKVDRARTRGAGGTGLGLAIAKHLVEGHGGVIWATSVEGQGSTFTVALPADEN